MALTRKYLKSLGLNDDQIEGIVEEHVATVDGLKEQISQYKADAEKVPGLEKELGELKAAGDGGYKEKYEAEQKAFADYKNGIEAEKVTSQKTAALDAVLQKAGVKRESFRKQILKAYDLNTIEMDGDAIKDADKLEATLKTDYADFLSTDDTRGVPRVNPPGGGGSGMTRETIMKIKDPIERQKTIAQNLDLFK